uniref:F-box domain-containing protein n=1 Tax=Chlamydomonas leiostraca TaxID=1034604 RepID=A0A7S0R9H6_9CHLO|mmetsp:Transcript_16623/g.41559  ORF Transcript_16623/g.41559 Transcript_16623/m.41559 type:complete len:684 (+) Transcript_16623:110-2161(+)
MDHLPDELIFSIKHQLSAPDLQSLYGSCSRMRDGVLRRLQNITLKLEPSSAYEAGQATFRNIGGDAHAAAWSPRQVTLVGDAGQQEQLRDATQRCQQCGSSPAADDFSLAAMIAAANLTPGSLHGRIRHLALKKLRLCNTGPMLRDWCNGRNPSSTTTTLQLDSCAFQGGALQHLVALPSQQLCISSPYLSGTTVIPLDSINTSVTSLQIHRGVTESSWLRLSSFQPLTALTNLSHLSISHRSSSRSATLQASHLAPLTRLTSLSLHAGQVLDTCDRLGEWYEGCYNGLDKWLPMALPALPLLQSFAMTTGCSFASLWYGPSIHDLLPSIGQQSSLTRLQIRSPCNAAYHLGTHRLAPVVDGCRLLTTVQLGVVTGAAFVMLVKQLPSLQHLTLVSVKSHLPEDLSSWESTSLQSLALGCMSLPCQGGSGLARMPLTTLKQPLQIAGVEAYDYTDHALDAALELGGPLTPEQHLAAARADAEALLQHLLQSGQPVEGTLEVLVPRMRLSDSVPLAAILDAISPVAPLMHHLHCKAEDAADLSTIAASQLGQAARWLVLPWRVDDELPAVTSHFPAVRVLQVTANSDDLYGDFFSDCEQYSEWPPHIPAAIATGLQPMCSPLPSLTHIAMDLSEFFRQHPQEPIKNWLMSGREERPMGNGLTVVFGLSKQGIRQDKMLNDAMLL